MAGQCLPRAEMSTKAEKQRVQKGQSASWRSKTQASRLLAEAKHLKAAVEVVVEQNEVRDPGSAIATEIEHVPATVAVAQPDVREQVVAVDIQTSGQELFKVLDAVNR